MAFAGCGLSLSVHAITLLGFHSKALLDLQLGLFLGVFPVFLAAVLAQQRLLSEFSQLDRFKLGNKMWRVIVARTPKWLRTLSYVLMGYALALFAVFAYLNFRNESASELDEIRLMSAYSAAFYTAAAMVLVSYVESEHPLGRDEIR
ncbi:MAG TPA: hypothetical protein VEU51_10995 [Candidatus Acidoferrales bacterium]|nr:hypothetical protein [Candidatus Acidoferrales bacterium]